MYLKFICNRKARMNPSFHNFHFVVSGHACFGMSFGGHLLLHFPMGPRFVNLLTCREYPYQVLLCFILFYSSFSGSDIISLEERSTLNRGCGNTVQVQECDCWCQSWHRIKCGLFPLPRNVTIANLLVLFFFLSKFTCSLNYIAFILCCQISTTLTFSEILPSTKTIASFKVPDYNTGKVPIYFLHPWRLIHDYWSFNYMFVQTCSFYVLWQLEVQYFHDHATFTTAFGLNQSPAVDVSATIGTPSIAFGAEAGYDTTSGNFTKYSAGISLTKPDSSAAIIV